MLEVMESLEGMDNGVQSCNGGMESLEFRRNVVESCNGGLMQVNDSVGSDNPDAEILEDFDSYMQEVDAQLIISRVVSDSVIKGMVNAVREEAAEEIAAVREEAAKKTAQKEQEVTKLKELLHIYHVGVDENEFLGSSVISRESKSSQHRRTHICSKDGMQHHSSLEAVAGHDRIAETLVHLRGTTNKEFKKLKKEIDSIRGCSSMKRIGSSSGLGDILQDKVSDRWDVDRTMDSLKTTIETIYQQVDEMVASVNEWQLDQELKDNIEAEIEVLLMRNSVEETMGEFFYGEKSVNWHERKKEISGIRDELDAISKSLSVSDNGQLSLHGSLEGEEQSSNGKKGTGSHSKVLNNLKSASSLPSTTITTGTTLSSSASSLSSLWEENGLHAESEINMEEHFDPVLLKHMRTEELICHFKNEVTKLKRKHELKIQDLTEQHFSHMREVLKERRPLTLKKNKEFDMLKKRISEVISKVDEILVEKEEVATLLPHTVDSNEESLNSLNGRLESLLSENHQLRESLEDKKREIECLSLQVSEASENLSHYSLAKAKLLKTAENLKADKEDAGIEALICGDLFACIVREVVDEIICIVEESQVENSIMHEIYRSKLNEAFNEAEPATDCELEDLNMEFIITQELCGVIYKDALKDAEERLNELNIKYIDEYELRGLQEMQKQEKEKQLELEAANKVRLQQEVLVLGEEKEQLVRDAAVALASEKERYELAAQEVSNLRGEMCQHQRLISERVEKESNAVKRDLVEAFEQNERHKADICKLEQKLEAAVKELREVEEDRRKLLDVNQEKQIAVSLFEAKEKELNEQFESIAIYVSGLLKTFSDFECRVTQDISGKCSRLKSLTSQSHLLKQKADVLVRRGLLYKQRFEKKCSDLEKAEAEVDLLGDEVDTLLNLVEKVYIALDHYSPILQHYPGITEILKLVRKELSAEIRSV